MDELVFEMHESLASLLSLLSSQPPSFDAPLPTVPGNIVHGSTTSSTSLSSISSSRGHSSSTLDARRLTGSAYEIRRAARRLDRVVHSFDAQMETAEHLVPTDDLVTVLTDLGLAIETFLLPGVVATSDDVWQLYNKTALESCRILIRAQRHRSLVGSATLQPNQIGLLLDRIATLLVWKRNAALNVSGTPPQEPLLLGYVVELVNTAFNETQQNEGTLLHFMKPSEAIQLLWYVLSQCMKDLVVRWNAFELDESGDSKVEVRVLAGHLLEHLAELINADIPTTLTRDERKMLMQNWFDSFSAEASKNPEIARENAQGFLQKCHDFGIELTEYTLDVIDGASLVLATSGNSPRDQCVASLRDVIRHVSLATKTAHFLDEATASTIPLRSLFVEFATFLASSCHQALLFLREHEQQNDDLDEMSQIASVLLVELARAALNQSTAAPSPREDPGMDNALAITLLRGFQVPEAAHDMQSILEIISSPVLPQPRTDELRPLKKVKCDKGGETCRPATLPFQSRNMMHVLQAASMASLMLPNYGAASSTSTLSKQQQVTSLLKAASKQNMGKTTDPWQSLLARKMSEKGFGSSSMA